MISEFKTNTMRDVGYDNDKEDSKIHVFEEKKMM